MNLNGIIKGGSFALLALAATGAFGQELNLQGSASGTFNGTSATSIDGLSYTGSTFNVTTSGDFYALGNDAATVNVNNLGSFTLAGSPAKYNGDTFTLDVTFSAPGGITNGSSSTYTALLEGQVSSTNTGGALVSFANASKSFNFSNAQGSGSFDLNVNDVSITPGHSASVTGYGMAAVNPVPEPASMFCIATGLAGVILKRRKK